MVTAVKENMKLFTDHQIEKAKEAQKAMYNIRNPSDKDFRIMIEHNLLKNDIL